MTRQRLMVILLIVAIVSSYNSLAYAQMNPKVKRSVATMIFSSLGGAVLGLSTLSFYGKPEDHVNNITLGALLGFIGGAGYVAYDSTQPRPSAYDHAEKAPAIPVGAPLVVKWNFDF